MPYKQLVKLSETDYRARLAILRRIALQAAAEDRKLYLQELQEHIEPLAMHWSLIGKYSTTPIMCHLLTVETTLVFNPNSLAISLKKWGIPPANGSGRGAARPSSAARRPLNFKTHRT